MEWSVVEQLIQATIGKNFKIGQIVPLSGGCINSSYKINGDGQQYFVKVNRKDFFWAFETEALALNQISATETVKTPAHVCHGSTSLNSFLVLEWLDLKTCNAKSDRLLGRQLAEMHKIIQHAFGWPVDNAIGCTRQPNPLGDNWVEFWLNQRLMYQLTLAEENGFRGHWQGAGRELGACLAELFRGYSPLPSLLHGDLWSGNYAMDKSAAPVIFDPASYYGDREADIAMTELFGGFGAGFYSAYNEAFNLDPGYAVRKTLYNLYHVLNHVNLFGAGYLGQAETMINKLLAEVK